MRARDAAMEPLSDPQRHGLHARIHARAASRPLVKARSKEKARLRYCRTRCCASLTSAALALLATVPKVAIGGDSTRECIVAHVDDIVITEHDLSQRVSLLRVRSGDDAQEDRALVELLGETLESVVARGRGVAVTSKDVAELDDHASRTSREPKLLEAMRDVFRDNPAGFARQVLAPRITSTKLRSSYATGREEHADPRRRVEAAYSHVRGGETMGAAAMKVGGDWRRFTLGKPLDLPGVIAVAGGEKREDPVLALVRNLPDGALYDHIVEDDDSVRVIRRLAGHGQEIEVEAVVIAKRPFDDWYREQAVTVPIAILDPSLADKVCNSYGQAWWLESVCIAKRTATR